VDAFLLHIDRFDGTLKMELGVSLFRLPPNAFQRFVLPKTFGERRTIVRFVGLDAENANTAWESISRMPLTAESAVIPRQ
jgi:hypothetical protein